MKKILPVIFFIFLLLVISGYAFVYADSKPLIMQPTSEGPGYILPDSPLYFLDKFKQSARLFLAVTPETKAAVYESVAGERLAEVRVELAKANIAAAEIALEGLKVSTRNAADELAQAQFLGENVTDSAKKINLNIKQHLVALDSVEPQATGEIKSGLAWAQSSLEGAKAKVETSLPKDELENEISDDTIRITARVAFDTVSSSDQLKANLDILQKQANNAAKNNLQERQNALQAAIAQKNDQLKKTEELKLAGQKRKDDLSLALEAQAQSQAQDLAQKAQAILQTLQTTELIATASDIDTVLGISKIQNSVIPAQSTSIKH